ncbi:MAG TPA: AIM24 family protein [Chloroflexota bacterium]|nr:AIM24 family protein [Chloroflexota bacterium]
MSVPQILPTQVSHEGFAGVNYRVEGELVPSLHVQIDSVPVYFEHHVLLWKDPEVGVALKPLKGALKRALAGVPVFLTVTAGRGDIAFSRDGAGHVFGLHLRDGEEIHVREHQFLAATDNVEYTFSRVKGVANLLMGGTGFFIDNFRCPSGEGIVWLHGYGNVFEVSLEAGQAIDVEPGAWIYKSTSVNMETKVQGLSSGLFGSGGQITWNRFTGPGKIGIQSMSVYIPESK